MQQLQGLVPVLHDALGNFSLNMFGKTFLKHNFPKTEPCSQERWSVRWDLPIPERNTAHNYNLTHNLFQHQFDFQIKIQAGPISGFMLGSIPISGVTHMPKPILWCQVTNEQHYIVEIESWFCFHRKQLMSGGNRSCAVEHCIHRNDEVTGQLTRFCSQ